MPECVKSLHYFNFFFWECKTCFSMARLEWKVCVFHLIGASEGLKLVKLWYLLASPPNVIISRTQSDQTDRFCLQIRVHFCSASVNYLFRNVITFEEDFLVLVIQAMCLSCLSWNNYIDTVLFLFHLRVFFTGYYFQSYQQR